MTNVRIVPTNSAQIKSRIRKISKRVGQLEKPHKSISIMLDRWVQMNFRTEGGKVGKWKKLKAGGRYVSRNGKRKLDVSAKILQDTGRLRKSFLPFHNKKDAGIGSDLPYSKPHEEGEGPLPKRRILPLVKEVRRNVVDIYDKHIRKSIR